MRVNTANQKRYFEKINNKSSKIILGIGEAGCGKTHIACSIAAEKLLTNKISHVVLVQPEYSEYHEKIVKPVYDTFLQYMTADRIKFYIKNDNIEVARLQDIRGRTLANSFIIADDAQNITIRQMKTLLTRIGNNSKMVVMGDITQSEGYAKGLADLLRRIDKQFETSDESIIDVIKFTNDDIIRSDVVKKLVELYDSY
jgi:phosphate starvation-inducible PhoH-like protein